MQQTNPGNVPCDYNFRLGTFTRVVGGTKFFWNRRTKRWSILVGGVS